MALASGVSPYIFNRIGHDLPDADGPRFVWLNGGFGEANRSLIGQKPVLWLNEIAAVKQTVRAARSVWLPNPWVSATIRANRGMLDMVEGRCAP
jgi:hypothetical protein